jgi:hypothetical protein
VKYLVDSDWLIDGLQGIPSAITALESLKESGLGISIVSFGEIYEGAFGFPDPTIHLQEPHLRLRVGSSPAGRRHYGDVRTNPRVITTARIAHPGS